MNRMTQWVGILIAAGAVLSGSAFAEDRSENITLEKGTTTVKGAIKGYDSVQYMFSMQANQELLIRMNTTHPAAFMTVERPGLSEAVCHGAVTGNVCSVRAITAADYMVDVFLMRDAARRGEGAQYTINIEPRLVYTAAPASGPLEALAKEAADKAVTACKAALKAKTKINDASFTLFVSRIPSSGGHDVYLSLNGNQWLCTTDSGTSVLKLEPR